MAFPWFPWQRTNQPLCISVWMIKWHKYFNTPNNKSSARSKFGEFGKIYQYTAITKLLYHYWLLPNFLPVIYWFYWFINFIISPTKLLSFMTQLATYTIMQSVGHIYMQQNPLSTGWTSPQLFHWNLLILIQSNTKFLAITKANFLHIPAKWIVLSTQCSTGCTQG